MGHQFGGNHTFNGTTGSCGGGNRNAVHRLRAGQRLHDHGLRRHLRRRGPAAQQRRLLPRQQLRSRCMAYSHDRHRQHVRGADGDRQPAPPVVDAGPTFTIPAQHAVRADRHGQRPQRRPAHLHLGGVRPRPRRRRRNTDNGSRADLPLVQLRRTNPTRTFPKLSDILEQRRHASARSLPTTTRTMTFRVTARDNRAGGGGVDSDRHR